MLHRRLATLTNQKIVRTDNSELLDFMAALEKFLRAQFKYRTQLTIKGLGPTIDVSRHSVRLYLRFKPDHYAYDLDRPLVIAVMGFRQRQQGHGTALLNFIIDHADEFDLGTIALESANSQASAFAEKRGFHDYPSIKNSWQVSIEDLRSNLISKKLRH